MVKAGSHPDRQTNQLHESIVASEDGKVSEIAARCRGRFNRKDASKAYQKSAKLLKVLESIYTIKPKLRAVEFCERMKVMKDPVNGGLLFCWENGFTTGMLLSMDQLQSWITQRTQKKKKDEQGTLTEKDTEEQNLVAAIEEPDSEM
jgi:hypothetical protein